MTFNIANWPYVAILLALLLLAGAGEYFHLAPAGTFGSLLLVVVGLIAPSPLAHPATATSPQTTEAIIANTAATQANTTATIKAVTSPTPTVQVDHAG